MRLIFLSRDAFVRALLQALIAPIAAKSLNECLDNVTEMYAKFDPEDAGLAGCMKKVRAVHATGGGAYGNMANVEGFKCHQL